MSHAGPRFIEYCCPRCKGDLAERVDGFSCRACKTDYPIVLGIPDFRVFPDPYISIADDHRKGGRIAAQTDSGADFRGMVDYYWSITPDTPAHMAERFTAVAVAAAERGRRLLDGEQRIKTLLAENQNKRVLDIGSRTGGLLLAAAERAPETVGIDIAFRWLIIARKRLEEAGRQAQLVCCCAEYLPFKPGSFDLAVAENVLEHTSRQQELVNETHRVLKPGGLFFATTWNRLAAAPEPHVRLWGVGWLPRNLARRYVKWAGGGDYDHVHLISAPGLRSLAKHSPFKCCTIELPVFSQDQLANVSPLQRRIVGIYHRIKDWPLIRQFLLLFGPVFHAVFLREKN